MPDDRLTTELAEIKEREQAATEGPWGASDDENAWRLSGDLDTGFRPPCLIEAAKYSAYGPSHWPNGADATFIVAARSDVPRLVKALEAALKVADDLAVPDQPAVTSALTEDRAFVRQECAARFRAAITREMTGEGNDGG